jgi:hypothetical protein
VSENPVEQKEAMEKQPKVSAEEATSATDVLLCMVKTSKAFKMYLANNPTLHRFLEELKTKLGDHLDEYGDMRFDIDQLEVRYKGKVAYENPDPVESLAFKMYSDGIRSLIFAEGIEEREIREFLEIIGTKPATDTDDDIVTLLWIKELPHIACMLADDYLEYDAEGTGSACKAPQQDTIKGLHSAIPPVPERTSSPILMRREIISPTEEEIACLRKAKEADESGNALDEVIQVLSAILSVEKDADVFGDFAEITVNLIGNLIHSGNIDYALAFIQLLRDLAKSETLAPDNRDKLAGALKGDISAEIIKDLEGIMGVTDKIQGETLRDILLLFGRGKIKQICELLGTLQKVEAREVVIDVLASLGKDSPEAFYPYLTSARWQLVRDVLVILRKIGSPASLGPVSSLVSHDEPKVRKEVLLSLDAFPGAEAKAYILKFLQEESSPIRILAVKILAACRYKDALKPITEIVLSKKFDEKDIAEKKALFEALGDLGGDEVVPLLKKVLLRKYWFNKAQEVESVTLAVLGLRKVKTEAALKALEEGNSDKKEAIKIIIDRARRGMEAERARGVVA